MELIDAAVELHWRRQRRDGGAAVAELLLQGAADELTVVDRAVDVAVITAPKISRHGGQIRPAGIVIDRQTGDGEFVAARLRHQGRGPAPRKTETEQVLSARRHELPGGRWDHRPLIRPRGR